MRLTNWLLTSATVVLLGWAASAPAQESKVEFDNLPKAVQQTVKDKFPDAKIKGASKEKNDENETVYEIEMIVKGKTYDIIVDPRGDIELSEEEIDPADLPRAVKTAYAKAFPAGKIEKAEKLTDEDRKVTYEVMVKAGAKEPFEVVMAPDGAILKSGADDAGPAKKVEPKDEDDDKPKAKKKAEMEDEDEGDSKARKKAEMKALVKAVKKAVKEAMREAEEAEDDDKPKAKAKAEMEDDDAEPKAKKKAKKASGKAKSQKKKVDKVDV